MPNIIKVDTSGRVILIGGKPTCVCCGCADCLVAECYLSFVTTPVSRYFGSHGYGDWMNASLVTPIDISAVISASVCFPRAGIYKAVSCRLGALKYPNPTALANTVSVKNAKLTKDGIDLVTMDELEAIGGVAGSTVIRQPQFNIPDAGTFVIAFEADLHSEQGCRAQIELKDGESPQNDKFFEYVGPIV